MRVDDPQFFIPFLLSWRVISIVVALVVLVPVLIFLLALWATERGWQEAYAAIEIPDGVTFHTDLIAWQSSELLNPETQRTPYGIGLQEAEDRIARWTRLIERLNTELDADPRWAGILDNLVTPFSDLSSEEQTEMEAIVVENDGILEEIRELANIGGPVYPLDYSLGMGIQIPHLAPVRNMSRLLRVSAKIRTHSGDATAALEEITTMFQLADAIAPEPILINQLVRHAVCAITFGAMQFDLKPESLSQMEIDTLFARLRASSHRDRFAEAFLGEALTANVAYAKMNANPNALGAKIPEDLKEIPEEDRDGLSFYGSFLGTPLRNMDRELYFTLLIRIAEANHSVFYQAHPELMEIEQTLDNAPKSRRFTKIVFPALIRASKVQARLEAQLGLVQLGIVAERYKADQGDYPESLDTVADAFGGELPLDPFTGEPYHYSVEEGSLLLYSIGEDLEDDGGTHDFLQGDIVWRGIKESETKEQ